MKAITVDITHKQVGLSDMPEPADPTGSQVKLRILDVGVCGTDREIVAFDYGNPPAGEDKLILGHESLGEVVAAGPDVKHLRLGDLAVTMVRRPCDDPDCLACRSGRQDFCYTGKFTERGINGRHGFMTEFVVDEERFIVPVPAELREVAVLTEPLTIAEKAVTQVFDIQKRLPWIGPASSDGKIQRRHKTLVLGAGPVGLLGAMKLSIEGFQTFVYSREPQGSDKCKLVEQIGATYYCADDIPLGDLDQHIGNIDLVYEATGASTLAYQALEELGINGVFCFTGVPGRKAPIEFNASRVMRRQVLQNQVVFGTVNAGRDAYEAAVADIAKFNTAWPGALQQLITSRRSLGEAVDLLQTNWAGIKNVIGVGE